MGHIKTALHASAATFSKQSTSTGVQIHALRLHVMPGFVEEGNPHDVLMVACPLPPVEQWGEDMHARAALLASRSLTPQLFLPAPQPGGRCAHPTGVSSRMGTFPVHEVRRPSRTSQTYTCHKLRTVSSLFTTPAADAAHSADWLLVSAKTIMNAGSCQLTFLTPWRRW